MIRVIDSSTLITAIESLAEQASFILDESVQGFLSEISHEDSPQGKTADILLQNSRMAEKYSVPLCQDTGQVILFVQKGVAVYYEEPIQSIADKAVTAVWKRRGLRPSIVSSPTKRQNTLNNTPCIIHMEECPGDSLTIRMLLKGAGSENQSTVLMMKPTVSESDIISVICSHVTARGSESCPPLKIGIGLGGNIETAAQLAKKALFFKNQTPEFEKKIMNRLASEKIGYFTNAVESVCVMTAPCHIASFPVGISMGCNAHRISEVII